MNNPVENIEFTASTKQITIPSASFTIPNYIVWAIAALVVVFITYSVIRTVPKSRPQKVLHPKVTERSKEEIFEKEVQP